MRSLLSSCRTTVFVALGLASPALADGADDYSYLRTAQSLDDSCHVLKFVERKLVDELAFDHIRGTGQYGFWQTGRMTNEEYNAWLDGLDAAADAKAAQIGCTQPAEAYLLQARGVASSAILQGMMLAHHLAGLPEDDSYRRPLHADLLAASAAYQGFLQQVYQNQYPAFHEAQRQAALARLPNGGMPVCDMWSAPDAPCVETFGGFPSDDYYEKMGDAGTAAIVVNDVLLEVAAETAGFRVAGNFLQKTLLVGNLIQPASGAIYATLVDGARAFRLQEGGEVFGAMAQAPDGSLRFMTYGTDAEKLRTGAVRLLVRTEPKPEGLQDWEIFNLEDYRSLTFPFDGVLLDEKCLGGPCFAFSPQATQAILDTGFDEKAELWLSGDSAAAPAATADWLQRNIVYPQLMRRLLGETPPPAQ
ncbi:MAG TPA: hypothetical protein VGV07_12595 [Devosia sp.]|uniref:hypothetical protein n=1 Tax=Devosia sp. TaxID=1871048 RepID=UPI002DDCC987|nr:hypothetical protein [Devosia sp.]HEV2516084.1 hypothetical protein [Devosia sp.]